MPGFFNTSGWSNFNISQHCILSQILFQLTVSSTCCLLSLIESWLQHVQLSIWPETQGNSSGGFCGSFTSIALSSLVPQLVTLSHLSISVFRSIWWTWEKLYFYSFIFSYCLVRSNTISYFLHPWQKQKAHIIFFLERYFKNAFLKYFIV